MPGLGFSTRPVLPELGQGVTFLLQFVFDPEPIPHSDHHVAAYGAGLFSRRGTDLRCLLHGAMSKAVLFGFFTVRYQMVLIFAIEILSAYS